MKTNLFKSLSIFLLSTFTLLTLSGCRVGGNMFDVFGNAFTSIGALLILVINVFFLIEIVKSNRSTLNKVIWVLVIWFMPILGALIYFFIGRDN